MSTILRTPDAIRTEVQNRYGRIADENLQIAVASSCCGPSSSTSSCCSTDSAGSCGSPLYLGEDLGDLPDSIVSGSLGCGNPQAIAALQPGEIVLDLGSGGGLDVLLAARQVGPTGFVYGVDMTDKMLELARTNAAKIGATNVEFRKGELESLPLPDNTVDVIISNCVVNLSPEKENALSEAFRVLKVGGRLAIYDIVVDGDLSGFPVSEAQIRAGLLPAGYAGGPTRAASGRAEVLVGGARRPCVGRLSMDMAVVDLGDLAVQLGAPVTVFGPGDSGEPTVRDWAEWSGTLEHEVVTGIGSRVHRLVRPARALRSLA